MTTPEQEQPEPENVEAPTPEPEAPPEPSLPSGDPDPHPDGADITAMRASIEKADGLIAHYHRGATLAMDLKRTLVRRLLRAQFPQGLSIDDEAKLLKGYGIAPEKPKK